MCSGHHSFSRHRGSNHRRKQNCWNYRDSRALIKTLRDKPGGIPVSQSGNNHCRTSRGHDASSRWSKSSRLENKFRDEFSQRGAEHTFRSCLKVLSCRKQSLCFQCDVHTMHKVTMLKWRFINTQHQTQTWTEPGVQVLYTCACFLTVSWCRWIRAVPTQSCFSEMTIEHEEEVWTVQTSEASVSFCQWSSTADSHRLLFHRTSGFKRCPSGCCCSAWMSLNQLRSEMLSHWRQWVCFYWHICVFLAYFLRGERTCDAETKTFWSPAQGCRETSEIKTQSTFTKQKSLILSVNVRLSLSFVLLMTECSRAAWTPQVSPQSFDKTTWRLKKTRSPGGPKSPDLLLFSVFSLWHVWTSELSCFMYSLHK